MSSLRPIAMNKKARWMNIDNIIQWLEKIYKYKDNSDFTLINKGLKITNAQEIFERNKQVCKNYGKRKQFESILKNKIFKDWSEIEIMKQQYQISDNEIIEVMDAGKARFEEKFGILEESRDFYEELIELKNMTDSVKSTLKIEGLSREALEKIELQNNKIKTKWVKTVFLDIKSRLYIEYNKGKNFGGSMLCCSDVIESIFGKFKMKATQVVSGIYETVLSIALFCNKLTDELITDILTNVRMSDVNNWFYQMVGQSNLSKRRIAFAKPKHKR